MKAKRLPGPGARILRPESWAPEIARKLRAGEELDAGERAAAAELLEHAAAITPKRSRRGRRRTVHPFRDRFVYSAVKSYMAAHPRDALDDDRIFFKVAALFSGPTIGELTAPVVRQAYYAEKRRQEMQESSR